MVHRHVRFIRAMHTQHANKLHTRLSDTELRFLAEDSEIQFLASIASVTDSKAAEINLNRAKELGIANSPLPKLIQGRDLQIHGYKGKEIGKKLMEIRNLQLKGLITSRKEALARISTED